MPTINDRIGSQNVIRVLATASAPPTRLNNLTDVDSAREATNGLILIWSPTGGTAGDGGYLLGNDIAAGLNISGITTINKFESNAAIFTGVTTSGTLSANTAVAMGSTTVITAARQLQNIASLDETTTATIETAISNAPNTFTNLNITGVSTFQNNVHLLDNDVLHFGGALGDSNGDLRIYHNASDSYIKDAGTGDLNIISNTIQFKNAAVNESLAVFRENSSVDLFFDNSRKFSTVGTGVSIVGIASASGGFEGDVGITTLAPSGGITTTGGDLLVYGSATIRGNVGNGVTVVGLTSTKNLHVTGISSLVTLDVGTVTSGLVVSGGSTIAGISSINTIHVGNGGTTFTVTGDGTFAIGSASTTVAATLNGGSIPSIGLVIALGG